MRCQLLLVELERAARTRPQTQRLPLLRAHRRRDRERRDECEDAKCNAGELLPATSEHQDLLGVAIPAPEHLRNRSRVQEDFGRKTPPGHGYARGWPTPWRSAQSAAWVRSVTPIR